MNNMVIKDFLGSEISIGDRVVYHTNQINPEFRKGIIKKFCRNKNNELTGWVDILSECNRMVIRYCTDVLLIK